jgi:FMN phosphatase YigB (HAD superfamily)
MALYVFDAYGTLFDVHAAAERQKDAIGPKWRELSILWRAKHLEYTWVYSLAGRQAMFWMLAQRSLDVAIAEVGGGISTDAPAPARVLPHHGALSRGGRGAGRPQAAR